MKSRFAKFQNVPELLSMYRTFADVVTKSDLEGQAKQAGERPLTPPVSGGKPYNDVVERSPDQAEYMQKIIYRMENLPRDPTVASDMDAVIALSSGNFSVYDDMKQKLMAKEKCSPKTEQV